MSNLTVDPRGRKTGGRERIAIVGSGISGLTAAHLLSPVHEVTLFEAGGRIGGHTNTVSVDLDGERQEVDTGFIVYNERNYPNFTRLLANLGVETQPTDMGFSVRCDATNLEYNGSSLNRMFIQRRNLVRPRFLRMVRDILRFNREAKERLPDLDESTTVDDWVRERGFGAGFVEHYLVPMGAALWSSPPETFRRFPIRFVIEFFANHALLDLRGRPEWRVISGGSNRYVEALTRPFADRIRISTPVRSVRRTGDTVHLTAADGTEDRFDHVIFACHSDQALRILADPSETERELLGAFPYQANEAILHTDPSVLPRRRPAWASWNYHLPADRPDRATVTYHMNQLQSLDSKHEFMVTLNDAEGIDPDRIIQKILYHHPVFTAGRTAAQARHVELIDTNRTSYCGAYWGYGFHEDGVRSALRVASVFGRTLA